jgi:hypothetical protein
MPNRTFDATRNISTLDNNIESTVDLAAGTDSGVNARAFIKFSPDFSGMVAISSATLHVHMRSSFSSGTDGYDGPITVQVRKVTDAISESTTNWGNQPGIAGTLYDFNANNPGGWETVDVTDIVKDWAPTRISGGGGEVAYGIRLKSASEGTQGFVGFHSRFDGGQEPYITVVYTENSVPDAPTLTSPSNGAVVEDTTPLIEFTHNDPDGDALASYDIQVDNNSGFGSPAWEVTDGVINISGDDVSRSVTTALTRGVEYYWRVRTNDGTGDGPWSSAKRFTIASLPVSAINSPSANGVAAPMYYTAGSDTTPKFRIGWSFSCAEGGSQASADIKVYADAGGSPGSLLHTHAHTGAALTADLSGYAPTNGTIYHISVTPTCSHGAVGAESSKIRCKARWARASYRGDLGSAPLTLSVTVSSVTNSGQVILEYASSSATTPEPTDWRADISEPTKQRYIWHRVTLLPQAVAAPTSPQLLSVVFTYSASALTPDNWTLASIASVDVGTYVYGTQSLKHSGDGTSKVSTQVLQVVPNTDYILSGRIKTLGTATATIELYDATGAAIVASAAADDDTDWTRYSTAVWNSGENSTITVRARTQGTGTAWFDALKMEASLVVTPWQPGYVGTAVVLDAGGLQVDAQAGGIFRLLGSSGGARKISLGANGLVLDTSATVAPATAGWLLTGDGSAYLGARLSAERITSNQTINNTTATTFVYNSIVREDDPGSQVSLNTGTGVVTIAVAGWYHIEAGVEWSAGATGDRRIRIRQNSVEVASNVHPAGANTNRQEVARTIYCAATDTIDVQVFQSNGSSITANAGHESFMTVVKVG